VRKIDELKKEYKGEWLAIEIIKEMDGQVIEEKLILHTSDKEELRNVIPLQKDKTIYITYANSPVGEDNIIALKAKELAEKGLLRLATNSEVEIDIPPRFPGKPLSEYLKEIRE
jgi:hypothetical protein